MLSLEAAKRLGLVETSKTFDNPPPELTSQQIGEKAYEARENRRLSRKELSKAIGVSEEDIFDLELGRMGNLQMAKDILHRIEQLEQ